MEADARERGAHRRRRRGADRHEQPAHVLAAARVRLLAREDREALPHRRRRSPSSRCRTPSSPRSRTARSAGAASSRSRSPARSRNYIARKLALTRSKTERPAAAPRVADEHRQDHLPPLHDRRAADGDLHRMPHGHRLLALLASPCSTSRRTSCRSSSTSATAQILPKERIPLGEGLNSWVVQHHQPLLLGSTAEERRFGVKSVADTKPTESWLGVPMIARDRVIGVISVESYRKNAFTADDLILLTAIANQAAVAIENAHLYRDLEGLTYALEAARHGADERAARDEPAPPRRGPLEEPVPRQHVARAAHAAQLDHRLLQRADRGHARRCSQPRLHRFLENIHAAGNHLLELINDILDLSKIEAGKMELRADQFDLRETIAAVERVMKGFAAEAKVQILSKLDPALPQVRLDEGRLKQILFNLLSNAVKFSPRGGVVAHHLPPRAEERLAARHRHGAHRRRRPGHRHPAGRAAADLRRVLPDRRRTARAQGRHGPRAVADAELRRAAPRADRGAVEAGAGLDVHALPAGRLHESRWPRLAGRRGGARRVYNPRPEYATQRKPRCPIARSPSSSPTPSARATSARSSAASRPRASASSASRKSASRSARPRRSTPSTSERPFFGSLVEYMTSGPVYVAALERDNAVADLRKLMGATDPDQSRRRHDPQGVRRVDRAERHPRLRLGREREDRDRVLLRGDRSWFSSALSLTADRR